MKPKKKTKKAVTLLTKIERLLSDFLDESSVIENNVEKNVREVLLSAQASIGSAIDFISAAVSPEVRQKAAKRKAKPSARAKKRFIAPAAKKRALKT